jgi:MFS transporter, ACS family, allantoate permease
MPLAKYSAVNVILWGSLLVLHAVVANFGGAVAVRFLLGVFESAVTPGFALLSKNAIRLSWALLTVGSESVVDEERARYVQMHQCIVVPDADFVGLRTGIWFSFNGMGQIFGGLVAYGIDAGAKKHGSAIAPWKTVFMVNGFITLGMGVLFYWVIPDNQLNAKWLSERDRVLAVARVRSNQQGIGQFPLVWCLM